MSQKDLHESNLTIAGSVILGSIIIAWAIISAAGSSGSSASANGANAALAGAPSGQQAGLQQPTGAAIDVGKVKTAGEASIGNPSARVTIAYWSDYQCPFCQRAEETVMPDLIKQYVDTGKVRIVFKDFAFLGADSDRLALAARAVNEVAPDKFYAWHKAVFDNQGQENSGWATDAKIAQITQSVLGNTLAQQVATAMVTNAAKYKAAIDADRTEGGQFGVTGTPSFVIGIPGKTAKTIIGAQPIANFQAAIDSL